MNFIIRNIKPDDIESVHSLISENGPYVASYNIYAYWILSNYNSETCKVAVFENKIIGLITGLQSIEKKVVFIWQLCVDHNFRNQTVAFTLIDDLVKSSKNIDVEGIELTISESNMNSLKLFRKFCNDKNLTLDEVSKITIGSETEIQFRISI